MSNPWDIAANREHYEALGDLFLLEAAAKGEFDFKWMDGEVKVIEPDVDEPVDAVAWFDGLAVAANQRPRHSESVGTAAVIATFVKPAGFNG
jgi:hypothetical protein